MNPLCDDPAAHVPAILREWEGATRDEPWLSVPSTDRLNNLPKVALRVLEAAVCPAEGGDAIEGQLRGVIDAAVEHGHHRRETGLPHELLLTEHYVLRKAIWRYIAHHVPESLAALPFLDLAVTVATRAAMLGYHATEFRKSEALEQALEQLLREGAGSLVVSRARVLRTAR